MAKIPIILEPGRADGKLVTSDAIFDENKGMFQSEINDIQDTLNSDNSNKPLSAKQGKILKELLDTKVIEVGAVPIDTEPIEGNITHVVNSDSLAKKFNKCNTEIILGGIYDVSAHNNGAVFESLQALLSSSNLSTLIPTSVRCGGMSIRFIQGSVSNSDNRYVQYMLMKNTWSIIESDWQGVDVEPTAGSENLVKSGGVKREIDDKFKKESVVPFAIVDSKTKKILWFDGKKVHLCDSDFIEQTNSNNGLNLMAYTDKKNISIYRIRANGYSDADLEIKMMLTNLLSNIIGYPSIEYMSEGFAEVYARTISGIDDINFKKNTIDINGIETNYAKILCDLNGNIINSISI